MISPLRLIAALATTLLLLADMPNADASESVDANDLSYALALLEASGVDTAPDLIERVIRGELRTIVWVQSTFEGLPVFFHITGYVFDPDGQPSTGPGGDSPLILGDPPDRQSFPVDHNPDVSEEKAFEVFRERLGAEGSKAPSEPLEAALGFHNIRLGSGDSAEYQLAWRVRPMGEAYPEAIVSAEEGDVFYFDTGLRSTGPIGPSGDGDNQPPRNPTVTGSWYSPRCEERSYTRSLTLEDDGTFLARDLVAPCPKDAQCIWSGIVVRSGTWRFDRDMIELTLVSESHPGTATPLPQFLRWESEVELVEVVVGGPMTCEYRRNRQ